MQEIQFLEFMGGSTLTHAHSNYLICMCLIGINVVFFSCTKTEVVFQLLVVTCCKELHSPIWPWPVEEPVAWIERQS